MLNQFLNVGDALDKMRQRTGLSVEALSELEHAAGQSGTDLATLETGIAKMQKQITLGGKAFESLGLSVEDLKKMSPEEQFDAVAKAIGDIEDPTERAGRAMEVFGKSGTQLLPMIEDMEALREEARELGFVMSGEAAASAVKLGDMLANLWKTVTFVGHAVGEALAPPLIEIAKVVQRYATDLLKWIQANKQLVVTIAAVGAAIVGIGLAITGLGLSITVAGVAMTGLATAIGAIGSVLGVVFSPLGLVVAALAAGVYLWASFTESGKSAVSGLKEVLGDLLTTATMTFGGIFDAIAAGDLALAGQIAMAGLKVAFLQGLAALTSAVGGMFGDFIGAIGMDLLSGDLSGAWDTVLSGLSSMLADFVNGAMDIWANLKNVVLGITIDMWTGVKGLFIEGARTLFNSMITLGEFYLKLQAMMGTDTSAAQNLAQMLKTAANYKADQELIKSAWQGSNENRELDRATATEIGDNAAAREAKKEAFRRRTRGGAAGASAAATDAEAELEALRARAAAARADADKEASKRREQAAGGEDAPGMAAKVFGTFSAAAFQAAGQNPALTEQKKTNKELSELRKIQQDALDFIKATGAWT